MEIGLSLVVIGIVFLLIWSAFFSSSETALMSVSKPRLHKLEEEGNKAAKRVNKLLSMPETLLTTILLGNNLVNIGASALATGVFLQLFGDSGIALATLVMTFLVLVFAEVIPKTLANRSPDQYAMFISGPMLLLIKVLTPFTWLIENLNAFIFKMMRIKNDGTEFHEDDVRGAIGLGLAHGVLEDHDHRMLASILSLTEITIEDVMIHRSAMESINIDDTPDNIHEAIAASSHTRFPVWEGDPDNITGFLHVKDYYRERSHAKQEGNELDIRSITQAPYFVPETAHIKEQLREFKKHRRHLAVVVDEYGDIQGLVTLEDILEEIVGEIEDEHDVVESDIKHEKDGSITIAGTFPVRDTNRELGWNLPEEDAVTIAGLLIETVEKIPAVGEKVRVDGVEFTVKSKKRQAIATVNAKTIKTEENN